MNKNLLVQKKKFLSMFIAVCMLFMPLAIPQKVYAGAPNGIQGNGTGGIYIDINAAPYTTYAQKSWGQYAYTDAGCAWFASARVNQLTGANCPITAGNTWYNTSYRTYGFSRGSTLKARALACYSNHVAIVEQVNGNTVTVSEGGYSQGSAASGYCVIHTMSKSTLESNRGGTFLGYVYIGDVGNPSGSLSYSSLGTTFVDTWNVGLAGRIENPGRLTVSNVGVYIWDSLGNLVVNHDETCGLNTSFVNQSLNVVEEALPSGLRKGETYTYQMYAVANGAVCYSGKASFTIVDDEKPVISNVKVTNITQNGYTVSCTATDNYQIDRVQFPTWTPANGQDDIIRDWISNARASGQKNGNTYTYQVNVSDHNGEMGVYRTHIYAYDKYGNSVFVEVPDVLVQAPTVYRITYQLNGGKNNSANPSSYTSNSGTITLKNPSRSGYTFGGWYSDSNFKTKVTGIAAGSKGDKTFYAKWTKTTSPNTPTSLGTLIATYNGDSFYKGDDGQIRCYDKNHKLVTNKFKFDGTYTYYLQADGTPMKDKLTYHPDGTHIIYLDKNGHEVFSSFQYCPSVGYTCYFDSNGYIYKDQITFVGDKTYYLNGNGKMENEGWFQFANGLDYGYANHDGTLNTGGFSYDPWGRVVFYHWNGMVARGLITDGAYYYSMDETDGHYLGQFPVNR